MTIMGVDCRWF